MAGAAHRSDGRLSAWHEDAHSIRTHAGEERLAKAGPGAEIEAAQWWLSIGGVGRAHKKLAGAAPTPAAALILATKVRVVNAHTLVKSAWPDPLYEPRCAPVKKQGCVRPGKRSKTEM